MAPGTRSKFGAPMFEPEVFQKKIHCIEVLVSCDIVGTFQRSPLSFGALIVIRRPGNCAPMLPSLRPWALSHVLNLATIYVKTFGSFGLLGSFFYQTLLLTTTRHYYLLA